MGAGAGTGVPAGGVTGNMPVSWAGSVGLLRLAPGVSKQKHPLQEQSRSFQQPSCSSHCFSDQLRGQVPPGGWRPGQGCSVCDLNAQSQGSPLRICVFPWGCRPPPDRSSSFPGSVWVFLCSAGPASLPARLRLTSVRLAPHVRVDEMSSQGGEHRINSHLPLYFLMSCLLLSFLTNLFSRQEIVSTRY